MAEHYDSSIYLEEIRKASKAICAWFMQMTCRGGLGHMPTLLIIGLAMYQMRLLAHDLRLGKHIRTSVNIR